MQHILTTVRNTLHRKEYSHQMIARLALNELAIFFNKPQLEGYMRYAIVYVALTDQSDIITLFRQKHTILTAINAQLCEKGYTIPIKDIRPKKIRKAEGNSDGFN